MLLKSRISTGKEQQEILPMDMVSFPYVCSTTRLDCCPDNPVPWHWHNVFEINEVLFEYDQPLLGSGMKM